MKFRSFQSYLNVSRNGAILVEVGRMADVGAVPFWAEAAAWLLILPAGMTGGALAAALPPAPRR